MEPRGCNRWQSMANRRGVESAKTNQLRCHPLPPVSWWFSFRALADCWLAAPVSGDGERGGDGEDRGRRNEGSDEEVGGGVAEEGLSVRSEGEGADGVDHVGERLVL